MQHVNLFQSFFLLCFTLSLASLSSLQSKEQLSIWEEQICYNSAYKKFANNIPWLNVTFKIQNYTLSTHPPQAVRTKSPAHTRHSKFSYLHLELNLSKQNTQPTDVRGNYWMGLTVASAKNPRNSLQIQNNKKTRMATTGSRPRIFFKSREIIVWWKEKKKIASKISEEALSHPKRTDNQPAAHTRWIPSCFSFRVVYCLRSWTVHLACRSGEWDIIILFGQLLRDACNIPPIARINAKKKKLLQASSPTEEPFWALRRPPRRPVNTLPGSTLVSNRVFRPHATSQRPVLTSFTVLCIICVHRICIVYTLCITFLPVARCPVRNL